MRGQMMLNLLCPTKFPEVAKAILSTGIDRLEFDRWAITWTDLASRQDANREVDGHRARMEEVQRPQIESAPCKVHATGCMRDDPVVFEL
jgi:hypothetical protein